jgi:hypothetical protein
MRVRIFLSRSNAKTAFLPRGPLSRQAPGTRLTGSRFLRFRLLRADHSGKSVLLEIEQICLDHPGNSLYNFDAVHESGKKPITSG